MGRERAHKRRLERSLQKTLELLDKYIQETQAGRNKLEELVEEIIRGMRQGL